MRRKLCANFTKPKIETSRLVLRKARIDDAESMFVNWANDSEVTKFLTWPPHVSQEISKKVIADWIAFYENIDFYQWMITLKGEEFNPIGLISVVSINSAVNKVEIGYCIGKIWWSQGIMTEALAGVMDYMFHRVNVNRIEAMHDSNNPASGAVMRKCGMEYEGTLRKAGRNNQGICDLCVYAKLSEQ